MKIKQILKYIVMFFVSTFLLFWGSMIVNSGNSSFPGFSEVLLYYIWMFLFVVMTIKNKIKNIFKKDDQLNNNQYNNQYNNKYNNQYSNQYNNFR